MSPPAEAVALNMMRGLDGGARFTADQVRSFLEVHGKLVETLQARLPDCPPPILAAVGKALLWYGEDRLQPLLAVLAGEESDSEAETDPCLHLRRLARRINRGRGTQGNTAFLFYKKAVAALAAFVRRRPCRQLLPAKADIFYWHQGWAVPARS